MPPVSPFGPYSGGIDDLTQSGSQPGGDLTRTPGGRGQWASGQRSDRRSRMGFGGALGEISYAERITCCTRSGSPIV